MFDHSEQIGTCKLFILLCPNRTNQFRWFDRPVELELQNRKLSCYFDRMQRQYAVLLFGTHQVTLNWGRCLLERKLYVPLIVIIVLHL